MKSAKPLAIRFGPLGTRCVHLCVDMQRIFAEDTEWKTPWMARVLPKVERIVVAHPADTIFTRFITLASPEEGRGAWKRYYERWRSLTTAELALGMLDLVEPLTRYVPPGAILDKTTYSPWIEPALEDALRRRGTDTLIITGGETDICVLGAVLGAVDRGYRTIIVTDALCSSSDESHDAMITLYHSRFGEQVETVETEGLLDMWR